MVKGLARGSLVDGLGALCRQLTFEMESRVRPEAPY
jgi:hypothetical protein